ncbi:thiol peroxidase [Tepidibacter aestuarii]|uniref:thiol peroxidase n=1 Tax=Tepidibacter aestuarii TaxID=2925782 RepID=UPI0020C0739D|nr:thiol peroxidase [Tepidibacter aestuarii]CAH2213664.1 thiol peroxidase (lipid hydroperoxide reductase) [Tepidibacter aestuarii]CAH2215670.1 thiol peroxidase (lipid hydroperoxide reductase) [Tepidibacter aestuarii]
MNKRTGIITMGSNPMTLLGNEIKIGDTGFDFMAFNNDLSQFKLSDIKSKTKIISVVPSVDTGVCELQTIRFNEEASKLEDTAIITISVDLPFAQSRFCANKGIKQSITVSDYKDLSFGLNYGFVIEELRLLARGIVVLDENNVVKHIEYVTEVTNHPDYDKAIEIAKNI